MLSISVIWNMIGMEINNSRFYIFFIIIFFLPCNSNVVDQIWQPLADTLLKFKISQILLLIFKFRHIQNVNFQIWSNNDLRIKSRQIQISKINLGSYLYGDKVFILSTFYIDIAFELPASSLFGWRWPYENMEMLLL